MMARSIGDLQDIVRALKAPLCETLNFRTNKLTLKSLALLCA
jgi:hypothetical protein